MKVAETDIEQIIQKREFFGHFTPTDPTGQIRRRLVQIIVYFSPKGIKLFLKPDKNVKERNYRHFYIFELFLKST